MTDELKTSVETALKAFNEVKDMVQGFDKKLNDITPKLDAFDQAKLTKLEKSIGDAVQAVQDQNAKHAAQEQTNKLLEAAINRMPQGNADEQKKELAQKRNKLFNDFTRDAAREKHFDEFLRETVKDENERKALSVGSDPSGGYLVMPEFGGIITTKVYESSPLRSLATVTTIGTDTYELILDNGEAEAGWVGETTTRDETDTPTLGKLSIPVHELYAEPRATQKVLDDASMDMEGWLADKVGEIFARTEATSHITGNGVNKPKGIMAYTAGTDISLGQVEQVVTGSASTFTYDGLVDLQNALKEPYHRNASFLFRRASLAHLLKIKDGEGRPIFNLNFEKGAGSPATLMGAPCYFAADIAAVGSNALAMAYGDFREAYQIVDRIGIRVLRDAYTAKPYIKFYTTKRTGGAVKNYEAYKIHKVAAA